MSEDKTTEKQGTRGIAFTIGHLGDGELSREIERQQSKLVEVITDYASAYAAKGKGSLTLKLDYVADTDGTVRVSGDVKIKEPKPKARGALFWATKGGGLSAENPRQTKMKFRDVNSESKEVRDVEAVKELKEVGQ